MKVSYAGKPYIIKVGHVNADLKVTKQTPTHIKEIITDLKRLKRKALTEVAIYGLDNDGHPEPYGFAGVAYCSRKDQFSKRTGRLLASERLLATLIRAGEYRKAYLIVGQIDEILCPLSDSERASEEIRENNLKDRAAALKKKASKKAKIKKVIPNK